MIITRNNYKSVECVKEDDSIWFTDKIRYDVSVRFLAGRTHANTYIFDHLGVDKYNFCTKAYGYKSTSGAFPECNYKDFEALTRVVKAIFEKLEEIGENPVEKEEGPQIITRDNYRDIKCVKYDDKIDFTKDLCYSVAENHLSICGDWENDKIFTYLGIKDKYAFCTEYYGYETDDGIFPVCKTGDNAALTQVMKALFDRVLEKEGVLVPIIKTVEKVCKESIENYYDNVKITVSESININIKL